MLSDLQGYHQHGSREKSEELAWSAMTLGTSYA